MALADRRRWIARAIHLLLLFVFLALATSVHAQDIEPRSYSNAPVGVNFLIAGYVYTNGGLAFDPSLPIDDVHLDTSSAVLGYARVIDLWGKSAKFDVVVPYTDLSGSADYRGQPIERNVNGFGSPSFRLSVNLYGAPALGLKEFAGFQQDLIIGASLRVFAPLGQYEDSRIVNISSNRWAFKPELGISKAMGRWTFEGTAAVTLFTDNTDFYGATTRSQDPVYSFQGNAIYSFASGVWAAAGVTYFAGGRSTIGDVLSNDLQQNWRVGGLLAFPVNARNSVKVYASSGVSARTGNNFDAAGVAWQYRWGGGI